MLKPVHLQEVINPIHHFFCVGYQTVVLNEMEEPFILWLARKHYAVKGIVDWSLWTHKA